MRVSTIIISSCFAFEKPFYSPFKGLEHCDVITSRQCQLVMEFCDDVRASSLKTCFPRVSELELSWTSVVYETEEELTSWLSTVQTVRGPLALAPQHEGESLSLCHLLNILAEKEDLESLKLDRYTLLLDVSDTSATVKQNNTLSELKLEDCKGGVDLGQLLEVCSRQCPQLETVHLNCSNLVFDDEKVESVKQLPGLQEFGLYRSAVHTPAGRRLSEQKAQQLLRRLCPSARIAVWRYSESDSEPDSDSDSGSECEFVSFTYASESESESGSSTDRTDSDLTDLSRFQRVRHRALRRYYRL